MPTYAWIVMWTVLLGGLAVMTVREIRSGRKITADVDRMQHQAHGEAGTRADLRGPGASSGGLGF